MNILQFSGKFINKLDTFIDCSMFFFPGNKRRKERKYGAGYINEGLLAATVYRGICYQTYTELTILNVECWLM